MKHAIGLTLVELLVAIALLAATAGTLLPMLTHYRAEAARTVCRGQLGEIGRALHQYADARGGRLPTARPMPKPLEGPDKLPALPMVVGRDMSQAARAFHCPGDDMALYPLCGSSYYYDTAAALRLNRSSGSNAAGSRTPLLWDADNATFRVRGKPVSIGPFHGRRQIAYRDGHVAAQTEPLPPPFGD